MRRRAPGAARALLVAAALFAAAALAPHPAAGALLAVDLGSEFLKLSIVKPGRIPISIVINEMSKRKTPALVAFVDGDRLVGEEAASVAARYPERVYGRVVDWLGRPADDPRLTTMLKASYRPYTLVPAANRTSPASLAVQTDRGDTYTAEEVVVSVCTGGSGLCRLLPGLCGEQNGGEQTSWGLEPLQGCGAAVQNASRATQGVLLLFLTQAGILGTAC